MPPGISILGTLLGAADPSGFGRGAQFREAPTLDAAQSEQREKESPTGAQRGSPLGGLD